MKTDGIWGNIFRFSKRQDSLSEILHHVPLFRELTPKELRILEGLVHIRTYQQEEAVFIESEPGAGMYVVRSGCIDIKLSIDRRSRCFLQNFESATFSARWRCWVTARDPRRLLLANVPI